MKIILLRHEKRGLDVGFMSPLTDEGYLNSIKLPQKLQSYKIDAIYSSPFLRTLQTSFFISNAIRKK